MRANLTPQSGIVTAVKRQLKPLGNHEPPIVTRVRLAELSERYSCSYR